VILLRVILIEAKRPGGTRDTALFLELQQDAAAILAN